MRFIRRRAPRPRWIVCFICAALIGGTAAPAPAQSIWIGGGATGDWMNAANWTPAPPTSSPTTAILFAGANNLSTSNNIANPFVLNSLGFDVSAGAFSINSGALQFQANGAMAPSLTKDTSATITFTSPVAFNATGSIGGSGTGSMVFGSLTAAQGTLSIARDGVSASTLTVQSGATIAPGSSASSIGTLSV